MRRGERYYRHIARSVLQRYAEVESGVLDQEFDARLLDYRMDIEKQLDMLASPGSSVLLAIYRDGCDHDEACVLAGLHATRPDDVVKRLECEAGRRFEKAGLSSFEAYLR